MYGDEIEELKKELDSMYVSFDEAKDEIWKRWNDESLRKRVDEFVCGDIPETFKHSPKAILARQVASPNFESEIFLKLSERIGLKSLFLEYLDDKFSAGNIDKYYLCKLFFHYGKDRNESSICSCKKIIDFCNSEGKCIKSLNTLWNQNLIEFHHKLLSYKIDSKNINLLDISEYYKENGGEAHKYYLYFFALFLCYGVLFENYLLDERQIGFTKNIVLPNYKKIVEIFGIKPLIVRLGPEGEEENLFWRYYHMDLQESVNNILNMDQAKINK